MSECSVHVAVLGSGSAPVQEIQIGFHEDDGKEAADHEAPDINTRFHDPCNVCRKQELNVHAEESSGEDHQASADLRLVIVLGAEVVEAGTEVAVADLQCCDLVIGMLQPGRGARHILRLFSA